MKLSTANLSKTLQNIKPMKRLAGKLKQAAGKRGVRKSSSSKSAIASQPTAPEATLKASSETDLKAKASTEAKAESSALTNGIAKISAAKSSITKASPTKAHAIPGFIQNSKLVQNSKGARVAFHLLLVKPWVLVVGLWVVSALSAVVAMEGLISPSRLTQDWPEPTAETVPVAKADSFIDVEQSAEGITDDGNEAIASELEASEVVASNSRLPIWPLVTLVGSCAAGCVVISRRRAMLRIAAVRARGRGRKPQIAKTRNAPIRLKAANSKPVRRTVSAPGAPTPVAILKSTDRTDKARGKTPEKDRDQSIEKAATPSGKKRRQRKRSSTQPTAIKPTVKPSAKSRVLASRSTAQQAAPQSRVSKPKRSSRNRPKVARLVRRQPVVSVVPANHANRLDWTEGSLAHDMDRRFSMEEAAPPRRVSSM